MSSASSCARPASLLRYALVSALSVRMTDSGVPAGATRLYHATDSKPGKPDSATVMTSGSCLERSRSEEHTSELQSPCNLVCRLLLEKKKKEKKKKLATEYEYIKCTENVVAHNNH